MLVIAGIVTLVGLGVGGAAAAVAFYPFAPHGATAVVTAATSTTAAVNADAFAHVSIQAHAGIVYDLSTGQVLFAKNSDAQLPLASLTKLLTVYAATGTLTDTSPVVMTPTALTQVGDTADIGFTPGETFAFKDIARLALTASSNTAAAAISEAAANVHQESGQSLMAGAAAAAGLSKTYALNASGLDENATVSGGYGSAKDIARLAGALLAKAPDIADATVEPSVTIRSTEGTVHTLSNTNPDVLQIQGMLLSKTGYTDLAGGNLVVVYDAGVGHPIAVAVLGSTRDGRFDDVQTLIRTTSDYFSGRGAPSATTTSAL